MKGKKFKSIIIWGLVGCAVAAVALGSTLRFRAYDYTHLLQERVVAEERTFQAIGKASVGMNMDVVAENDMLRLLINTETTEVAVEDKRSGEVWYSNPVDRMEDPLANKVGKSLLSTQIEISYFDKYRQEKSYGSYVDWQMKI